MSHGEFLTEWGLEPPVWRVVLLDDTCCDAFLATVSGRIRSWTRYHEAARLMRLDCMHPDVIGYLRALERHIGPTEAPRWFDVLARRLYDTVHNLGPRHSVGRFKPQIQAIDVREAATAEVLSVGFHEIGARAADTYLTPAAEEPNGALVAEPDEVVVTRCDELAVAVQIALAEMHRGAGVTGLVGATCVVLENAEYGSGSLGFRYAHCADAIRPVIVEGLMPCARGRARPRAEPCPARC